MRALYPQLLKRLDDANDTVRVTGCRPLSALFAAFRYSGLSSFAWPPGATAVLVRFGRSTVADSSLSHSGLTRCNCPETGRAPA